MSQEIRWFASVGLLLVVGWFFPLAAQPGGNSAGSGEEDISTAGEVGGISVMRVTGTIGPTTTNYLNRSLDVARSRGDQLLIMEMDTPGGLLTSTQEIVQVMLASELPIVVYVSPEGASAGSAGAFITLASHVAAMAPATTIGAASPVSMGGGEVDSVAQKKLFEFSESYIQSIADERGRNAEWARAAVRDGIAATNQEALELGVIDLIAPDMDALLDSLDGQTLEGEVIQTAGAKIQRIEPNLAENFFSFILRPEVMLILTMISIYGILGEVTNPGAIVPGVAGVIALILLLYGVAAMPINVAGFLLMGVAIALFVLEAFTPTFGVLLTGGAVSFFLGALMLFQDLPQEMQLSYYWLIPATLMTVLFFSWIVTSGIKAQMNEPRSGLESLVGKEVKVIDGTGPAGGRVLVAGEYWNALSKEEIPEGAQARIVSFEGLTVTVEPVSTNV